MNEQKFEVMMSFDQKMTRISMSMLLQHSYNFSSETLIELETMPLEPLGRQSWSDMCQPQLMTLTPPPDR